MKHERERLHGDIEVPGEHSVQLALTVLVAFDRGSSHVDGHVPIEPLLAEHREEGRKYGSGQARVQDALDLDYRTRGTAPLRKGRYLARGGIPHGLYEYPEQLCCLFPAVGLELGLDVDDEGGSHGREQTGLS